MIFPILTSLSLATMALGQMTHNVTVGAGGALAFSPNSITAAIGDTVQFLFEARNHTATQSSFQSPCTNLTGGFDSGFQPIDAAGDVRISTFLVTVDTPLWFHCRQLGPPPHCPAGMVFAVNAPATGNTFQQFLNNAIASGTTTTAPPAPPATSTSTTQATTTTSTVQTSNPQPVIHTIKVGDNNTLAFNPTNITAQQGDIVSFEFILRNHSATQSTFAQPCRPIGDVSSTTGFDSGFMPIPAGDVTPHVFNVTVNDTAPIWVYCKQIMPVAHCGVGMVFSVNAVESGPNTYEAFVANAERINGTSTSSTGTSSTASASATTTGKSGGASSTYPSSIVGLGLGGFAAVSMLLL